MRFQRREVKSLNLLANSCLGFHILTLTLFAAFEKCLVLLVNHSRGILESHPDFFTDFFCHRTCLAPFVMKFLQTLESCYHIVLRIKLFSFLTQKHLGVQILLKIIITKVLVHLQLVIEPLNGRLIALPLVVKF